MNPTRHARWRCGAGPARASVAAKIGPNGGFTLLELLLSLALLALFASLLIGGSSKALTEAPASADELFWKACHTARKAALLSGREIRLGFAEDRDYGKRFTVTDGTTVLKEFPVTAPANVEVTFLPSQKFGGGSLILAGQVVETSTMKFATFYPDGTCSQFRLQVRAGADSHVIGIDPWTCAAMLTPTENR
jgi:prepilin-type N-terminal cleavage/methylation domain-containing protein